ncbi:MAG: chaperone modulator CbpM [Dysgonamonadaceae bacterium]|jgi:hypothetical protein|nr:chaperone modulator CbpM [Dysgonamonadaceae bacterium]
MDTEYIIVKEYIQYSQIDPQFIALLEENGLIHTQEIENERCLLSDELSELERYARMYYDLSINMEGIDAIRHLLQRMQALQDEIRELRHRLQILE